jgi:GT2 family glycosyltransferase
VTATRAPDLALTHPVARPATGAAAHSVARPTVAALVVTHNRLDQLRRTVARLLAEPIDHLMVVDNASNDGTSAWLAAEADPRLTVVRSARNIGGAGGFHLGMSEMIARFDPDWCVLMDDDARPEQDMIARFRDEVDDFVQSDWHAIASGVFYPDGTICEMNRPSRNPFWHMKHFVATALGGGRAGFHLRDTDYGAATVQQVDATSFVGLFLSRQAMHRGGLPDGRLFLYGDDVIYTLNLSESGGRIGFAPWLRFEHDCSTFERAGAARPRLYTPLWKAYYNYRNGLIGYRVAAGPVLFWPVLALMAPKWFLRARAYGTQARLYRRLLRLAIRDALTGRIDRPHAEIQDMVRNTPRHGGQAGR